MMTGRTAEDTEMAGKYGDVLGSATSIQTRAHDLLDTLAGRAASSASAICLWDPIRRCHVVWPTTSIPRR